MKFVVDDLDIWGNYFRYFYFYEDMTFTDFLIRVKDGKPPQRQFVDWGKVEGAYERDVD